MKLFSPFSHAHNSPLNNASFNNLFLFLIISLFYIIPPAFHICFSHPFRWFSAFKCHFYLKLLFFFSFRFIFNLFHVLIHRRCVYLIYPPFFELSFSVTLFRLAFINAGLCFCFLYSLPLHCTAWQVGNELKRSRTVALSCQMKFFLFFCVSFNFWRKIEAS